MDTIKHGMVNLAPRYNQVSRDFGLRILANKHDELLTDVPEELYEDPRVLKHFTDCLEDVGYDFRVPIKWEAGWSRRSWKEAKP